MSQIRPEYAHYRAVGPLHGRTHAYEIHTGEIPCGLRVRAAWFKYPDLSLHNISCATCRGIVLKRREEETKP